MKKIFSRLFKILLAVVLGALGLFFLELGFHTLNTVRHIELTPQREIIAVLPGILGSWHPCPEGHRIDQHSTESYRCSGEPVTSI